MWARFVALVSRLRFALSRRRVDEDARREFEAHLELLVDRYIRRGMAPEEAHVAARRQFGNALSVREEIYEMNTLPFLDTIWQDLRYGIRILRKNPTFSLVVILTLALGTGANAAIFQLVNALRLRSLPVEQPHELVSIRIDQHGKGRVGRGFPGGVFTEPLWQEIRSQQQAFSSLFAWGVTQWDLSPEGEVALARGLYVSGRFFDVLGVHAHIGRMLTEADDPKGCGSPGAVLSHDFWQVWYGGNPGVIGQSIMLDRRRFDVIGVAQPGFFGVEVGRTFDARHHGTSEAGLDGGTRPGTCRRRFSRRLPGNRVPGIQGRLGEELYVVHAHRETRSYRSVEPADRVCDPAMGVARRHRPGAPAHVRESREPDACARHRSGP
ncbi:MAG: hypothetical protein AUF76_17850 [Acidobacteria bacterium 13_1_20CM_2_65_9]|nr:MAG: hypothetical protein AUF76_17850 [Acidobacteria bacterium 13_1_20CM_2_65_9]